MRISGALLACGFVLGLWSSTALAEARVALVIGNSAYHQFPRLANPANDAADVAAELHSLGFRLVGGGPQLDVTRTRMSSLVREFGASLNPGDLALFYYAGHGAAGNGDNYLIPVDDGSIQYRDDIPDLAYSASSVLRNMESRQDGINILILDACRNNPLPSRRADRGIGANRGLSRMEGARGTVFLYAASPGQKAQDGAGRNGPFASALVAQLKTPGLELAAMFRRVTGSVEADTGNQQTPWQEGTWTDDVFLHPGAATAPVAVTPAFDPHAAELAAYSAAQAAGSLEAWQIFRKNFPTSAYAATADIQIAMLSRPAQIPTPVPAPNPTPPPYHVTPPQVAIAVRPQQPLTGPAAGQLAFSGDITGAGATFPYPIYSKWASDYKQQTGVGLNYQSIGSGGGIKQIKARTVTFGASDKPLEVAELNESGLAQFPAVIGGVVPVFNVRGLGPGQLVLDGTTLADIFLGKIQRWNDPAISRLNPRTNLPSTTIAVLHRSDGSGTSFLFTSYLSTASGEWHDRVGAATAVEWPVGLGARGNEGMAGILGQTDGAIGYVEYAYAKQNGLSFLKLINRDGAAVAPTPAAFAAAAANLDWAGTGFSSQPINQAGAESWPITGASFILLQRQPDNPAASQQALRFYDWAFRHGGQMAQELDYVPLPENVVRTVEDSWHSEFGNAGGSSLW